LDSYPGSTRPAVGQPSLNQPCLPFHHMSYQEDLVTHPSLSPRW
jgi:hypothetical protein